MIDRMGGCVAPLARAMALVALGALAACSGSGPTRQHSGSMAEQLNRCRAESGHIYQAASFSDYVSRVRQTSQRCGIGGAGLAALSGIEQRAQLDIDRFPAGLYPQVAA